MDIETNPYVYIIKRGDPFVSPSLVVFGGGSSKIFIPGVVTAVKRQERYSGL